LAEPTDLLDCRKIGRTTMHAHPVAVAIPPPNGNSLADLEVGSWQAPNRASAYGPRRRVAFICTDAAHLAPCSPLNFG